MGDWWWEDPFLRRCWDATDLQYDALHRLSSAVAARADLEKLIEHLVVEARTHDQASWQDVADHLGITRQSAHRKFGRR